MKQPNTPSSLARVSGIAALTLLVPILGACSASGGHADRLDDDMVAVRFDDLTPGKLQNWRMDTTNQRAGEDHADWFVVAYDHAPSIPNNVSLTDAKGHMGQTFNLLWDSKVSLTDVDVMVTVRADGGEEDQGGGPAWRVVDESNYYVARWNPLEDNFRVYSVVDGERLQLATAKVHVDPKGWHTIRVHHVGDSITCWLDGEELLNATDSKLSAAGGVGVWTKADATTSFDNFGYK